MKRPGVITTLPPTVLIDAGPLIALVDHDDPNYERAMNALKTLPKAPFLTIWPCFTEAMYLLGRAGGYPAQVQLLHFLQAGAVRLWNPDTTQSLLLESRIAELMATYRATSRMPLSLAPQKS